MDLANTLLDIYGITDSDEAELRDLALEEMVTCLNAGDRLGAGEWLIAAMHYSAAENTGSILPKILSLWGSMHEPKKTPALLRDIVENMGEYVPEQLSVAVVAAAVRLEGAERTFPAEIVDLVFKISKQLKELFEIQEIRPMELLRACEVRYRSLYTTLATGVNSFVRTHCLGAKGAAVELIRAARTFKKCSLPGERPILSELEILLGPVFREFCESCEQKRPEEAAKLGPDLRKEAERLQAPSGGRGNSMLWHLLIVPVSKHVIDLIDEESRQSQEETAVRLALVSAIVKVDLSRPDRELTFSCRLANYGKGAARRIRLEPVLKGLSVALSMISPIREFDMAAGAEQLVMFSMLLFKQRDKLELPLIWQCDTIRGQPHSNKDVLRIEQQRTQPNWKMIREDPPYGIKPIGTKDKLFGRDEILGRLSLHANSGTSTFIWGQKRVGKTSVLQVFAGEIRKNPRFTLIFLRISEIRNLHEGQIAFTIAQRISANVGNRAPALPNEEAFGGSLARLVPFMDDLVHRAPDKKFLLIIDEFEDLNSSFYTGQRGRDFFKALRNLSEIGLTCFFARSERMHAIYVKHALDLNQWVDVNLDVIESREDCRRLIVEPLRDSIEYQSAFVDEILDYCRRNPYYMHLLCWEVFARCETEERTYVNESDLLHIRGSRVRSLGESHFAHFWLDNPELDEDANAKASAENCLVLTCIASLGGAFEAASALALAQEGRGLELGQQLSSREIGRVIDRLRSRKILDVTKSGTRFEISLPIFKEWLIENAEFKLLSPWRDYCASRASHTKNNTAAHSVTVEMPFPISEEDLLPLSQRLFYCGRQKDVSELTTWLRQFDDDSRIEIAYLLLKRLVERGFVDEGHHRRLLSILTEALHSERKNLGDGKWTIVRGHHDNLCISFLDSEAEVKSGAATARELAKSILPGKYSNSHLIRPWMKTLLNQDPLLLFVDDFSGTGRTVMRGLKRFMEEYMDGIVLSKFVNEGRILVYLLTAFPEALERLRNNFPSIKFLAASEFGEDVKALDPEAQIFDTEDELRFAKDVLFQLGKELTPQNPLGFNGFGALVCFHNTIPNNTLPIFWSYGTVSEKPWKPLFPRA